LEQGLKDGLEEETPAAKASVAILLRDATNRRLMDSVSVQLELEPVFLSIESVDTEQLLRFELVLADEPDALSIRERLTQREESGEGVNPAVVAVVPRTPEGAYTFDKSELRFDGILPLPQAPGPVTAQLGLILYSHRAFARRYHNALEELRLNRRIFRSVTSGISVADATQPDFPLLYVNPAFEVMTGYSFEEVLGKNCRFLQGSEHDQPASTLIREALRDGRETVAVLKNFRKDGTAFWNELSLSPIRNREGALTHFVGIQTDVTSRVEFEAALRESEKLAAVGRLASSIAHEINNPLESVMNLLYLAERADSLVDSRTYLGMADRELQRVKLITSQSLRFYKQSTRPQAIGSTELVDSVLDLYHSRLSNSRVEVERRGRATQSIVCMESEIRQVLNNLVSNAIDAMHGRGGKLRVRTREATDWRTGEHGVAITVADTGSGISQETLNHMYRAFYTTKGIGGTGLGLWISSEIVARHRGRLKVRTSQRAGASGTIFELFLPFQGLTP
jgi:PAS domain S-box-containing protein